ncbi:aminodeoxychorismate synthase component I [Alteromonas sp. a30]|uniref:aminodeoxychorismate synthase component I n=1 Tax=Alteromonas sp. a30 TaxID=2730917 RepID=UPI002280A09B|nr:aminodeoxychorismate synthase component I [Alteromonas sp. a30]MCY7296962.1 aminodeoxychorismate synthase component I [Alteromonas sp. a30]
MLNIHIIPLNINTQTDVTSLFSAFRHLRGAVLLDSANSPHPNARFDIFAAEPIISIEENTHSPNITFALESLRTQIKVEKNSSTIAQIVSLQKQVFQHTAIPETHLPFVVGCLGYFGYDWGKQIEKVASRFKDDYQTPRLSVGIYTWSVIRDADSGQYYFCYHPEYPHPSVAEITDADANKSETLYDGDEFKLRRDWSSNVTQAEYLAKLAKIHEYLLAGDCYQINMAQRFHSEYQGDEWRAYLRLRQANTAPFSSFIRTQHGAILSISPERFLSTQDGKVETKPIKGTRPRGANPELDAKLARDLQNAEKDRAENLMIVDLLRNDLSKNCMPGSVQVPKLFDIESFPAVHHLVSTVVGELKANSSPLQLLQDAFPGGSITGAPKKRAMQIIEELEPDHRHIYCGSIGYLGIKEDMDSNICIRTLLLESNNIYCWAGGGIVLDSDANQEFQETLDKVAKILPVLKP